jgi:hypothetical protein
MLRWYFKPGSDKAMKNKGFIFTMDAILAIIPVFIILASVSSVSYSDSLFGQVFMTGGERIANDVLKTLDVKEVLTSLNCTGINDSLSDLVPSDYRYNFEIEYNSTATPGTSTLCNTTSGDISSAADIVAARRVTDASFFDILAEMLGLSHYARERTPFCWQNPGRCAGGVGQAQFNATFTVGADEKLLYTFWLLGVPACEGCNPPAWWGLDPYNSPAGPDPEKFTRCPAQCTGAGAHPPNSLGAVPVLVEITTEITQNADNTIYIVIEGNPADLADFFVIRAPIDVDPSEITLENVLLRTWVLAKLEMWPR